MPRQSSHENVDSYTIRNIFCAYFSLVFSSLVFFSCIVVTVILTQYKYPILWSLLIYIICMACLYLTNFAGSIHILCGKNPTRLQDRRERQRELRRSHHHPTAMSEDEEIVQESIHRQSEQHRPQVHLNFSSSESPINRRNKTPPPAYEDIYESVINSEYEEAHGQALQMSANTALLLERASVESKRRRSDQRLAQNPLLDEEATGNIVGFETSLKLLCNMQTPSTNAAVMPKLTEDLSEEEYSEASHIGTENTATTGSTPNTSLSQNTGSIIDSRESQKRNVYVSKQYTGDKTFVSGLETNNSELQIQVVVPELLSNSAQSDRLVVLSELPLGAKRKRTSPGKDRSSGVKDSETKLWSAMNRNCERMKNMSRTTPLDIEMSRAKNELSGFVVNRPLRKTMTDPVTVHNSRSLQCQTQDITRLEHQQFMPGQSPHVKLLGTVSEGSGVYQNLNPEEWMKAWNRGINKMSHKDGCRTFGMRL